MLQIIPGFKRPPPFRVQVLVPRGEGQRMFLYFGWDLWQAAEDIKIKWTSTSPENIYYLMIHPFTWLLFITSSYFTLHWHYMYSSLLISLLMTVTLLEFTFGGFIVSSSINAPCIQYTLTEMQSKFLF